MINVDSSIRIFGSINGAAIQKFETRLVEVLKNAQEDTVIDIFITSAGGSTVMGRVFYEVLRSVEHKVRTIGVGEVYSTAAFMMQAGSERLITPSTLMLLHPQRWYSPESSRVFELSELKQIIDEFAYDDDFANDIFERRSKLSLKRIEDMRKSETLLRSEDIIKYGLADGIYEA